MGSPSKNLFDNVFVENNDDFGCGSTYFLVQDGPHGATGNAFVNNTLENAGETLSVNHVSAIDFFLYYFGSIIDLFVIHEFIDCANKFGKFRSK